MTTRRLRGMSRLTFRRLCVRAPRMRIVSIGESAILYEPSFPAPLPYFGEFSGPHEPPRAASEPCARLDLRPAAARHVHHPADLRLGDPGPARREPPTPRLAAARLWAHPGRPSDPVPAAFRWPMP